MNHPRNYIINPQHYSFDPSNDFTKEEIVETDDGVGVIVEQDSCYESFSSGKFLVWLDRWGVQFEGCDRIKYYSTQKIRKITPACEETTTQPLGESNESVLH